VAGLIADANGNLFGTTVFGGANDRGTVFEIAKTAGGYASTPTVLVSFNGTNGRGSEGRADRRRQTANLFGTTYAGGAKGFGHGVQDRQDHQRLRQPPHHPGQLLLADQLHRRRAPVGRPARRRQRQTCTARPYSAGANNDRGTVFEIAKTAGGYASTPTVLVSFCAQTNCTDGANPEAGLIADANGKPVSARQSRAGANGQGTVCSRSPRPPAAMPAPPPSCTASARRLVAPMAGLRLPACSADAQTATCSARPKAAGGERSRHGVRDHRQRLRRPLRRDAGNGELHRHERLGVGQEIWRPQWPQPPRSTTPPA